MIKLKAKHKTLINRGIQRVYNIIKGDYPDLQRVRVLVGFNPEMADGGGLPFFEARDLELEIARDYFIDPCNALIVAKSVTVDSQIKALAYHKLEECGFTLYADKETYSEMISL